MNANEREYLDAVVERVVGAFYEVSNVLGAGFLEKVYERALVRELEIRGLQVKSQVPVSVGYKGKTIGTYYADLVVEGMLVVELKCAESFCDEHLAQCLNYLRATGLHLALLVNFQNPRVQWRRVVREF